MTWLYAIVFVTLWCYSCTKQSKIKVFLFLKCLFLMSLSIEWEVTDWDCCWAWFLQLCWGPLCCYQIPFQKVEAIFCQLISVSSEAHHELNISFSVLNMRIAFMSTCIFPSIFYVVLIILKHIWKKSPIGEYMVVAFLKHIWNHMQKQLLL